MATPLRKQCFEAVLEAASDREQSEVIHAWIYRDDRWYVQAWCEHEGKVLDFTESRSPLDKDEYYSEQGVDLSLSVRYTRVEYFTLMADTGHFGPYDPQFAGDTPPE